MTHRTLFDTTIDTAKFEYDYQDNLTEKLDKISGNFDQTIIDQIVLWKVNRYAELDNKTLTLLNKINKTDTVIDLQFTVELLKNLLNTNGIRLPMASTILRFKNPNIYQIIDQRAFRLINKKELKIPHNQSEQIKLYLNYLSTLRDVCNQEGFDFSNADRVLYWADKNINQDKKIRY